LEVRITLHGILRDYLPRKAKGKTILTLPEGTTIDEVVQQLKIKQTVTAAIDGEQVETTQLLQDGDDLQMFRMIGGG
jgi:sulfur carrier protein ThiS